jgi:hypothetical protein
MYGQTFVSASLAALRQEVALEESERVLRGR